MPAPGLPGGMYPTRRHVAVGLVVAAVLGLGLVLSPGSVVEQLRGLVASPWFPAVLVGLYLVRPVLAWPITAITLLVGFRYGVVVGLPIALGGAVVTSLLPYAVGRHARGRSGPLAGAVAGLERFFAATGGLRGVVAARLAPSPAEPVSIAAGAGRVSVSAFVVGTAVGELPWTVAALVAGHSLAELSFEGVAGVSPWLAVAGTVAALVLLAGPAYRWHTGSAVEEPAN